MTYNIQGAADHAHLKFYAYAEHVHAAADAMATRAGQRDCRDGRHHRCADKAQRCGQGGSPRYQSGGPHSSQVRR